MSPSPVPRVRPSPTAPLTSALTPPLSPPTLQRENLSRPWSEETEDKGQRSIRQRPIVSRPPLPRLPPTEPWRGSALHLRSSPRRDSATNRRWPQTMRNQTGKYFFFLHTLCLCILNCLFLRSEPSAHHGCAAGTKQLIQSQRLCVLNM